MNRKRRTTGAEVMKREWSRRGMGDVETIRGKAMEMRRAAAEGATEDVSGMRAAERDG